MASQSFGMDLCFFVFVLLFSVLPFWVTLKCILYMLSYEEFSCNVCLVIQIKKVSFVRNISHTSSLNTKTWEITNALSFFSCPGPRSRIISRMCIWVHAIWFSIPVQGFKVVRSLWLVERSGDFRSYSTGCVWMRDLAVTE